MKDTKPSYLPSTAAILAMAITCGTLAFFFMITFVKHYATETIITQIIQVLSSALNFVLGFYFGGMYQKKKAELAAESGAITQQADTINNTTGKTDEP